MIRKISENSEYAFSHLKPAYPTKVMKTFTCSGSLPSYLFFIELSRVGNRGWATPSFLSTFLTKGAYIENQLCWVVVLTQNKCYDNTRDVHPKEKPFQRMNLPLPDLPHCGKLRGWLRCLSRFTIHNWQSCYQPNTKKILGKLFTYITTNPFQVHCDSSTGVAHCGRCRPAGISIYSTLQCSAHIGLTMSHGVSHDVLNSLNVVPDVPSLLKL